MMATDVCENVGGWSYERTLGSGGFGAVFLYCNEVTIKSVLMHSYSLQY